MTTHTSIRLYSVHILFVANVGDHGPSNRLKELTVRILAARNEAEAIEKGRALGRNLEHRYENCYGETVRWEFEDVLEVQDIHADALRTGMEVASWLWRGERLDLEAGWIEPHRRPTTPIEKDGNNAV